MRQFLIMLAAVFTALVVFGVLCVILAPYVRVTEDTHIERTYHLTLAHERR